MANYLGNIDLKREKTPSIEQKIANIMGTTTSQVRALSDDLTAQRKAAEEAAKKAAQDQAARAKAEAALAAQRSAAAAKQSEAARVANAKAIKQRLSAGLKKPAQTSAAASAPATMVAIDTDILPAGTDTRSAIRSGKAYYDQLVEEGTQRADRSGAENALNGLEYETEKAKAQVETAAAAYNKTAGYLKQQAAKIDELSEKIEVYSSNAEGMNAADRTAYNELVRQRDVAIDLYNRAAGQGQKWASTYETAAQNLSDASTAQGRVKYSNDAGAHLEGEITMAQGEYERVREYIRTNGAYIVQEYAMRGEDGNAYMEDLLARSEQAVNDAKTAYAAWQSGKFAFEADIMEYDLPAADRMYFRRIAEYETYRGNFAKVGDSGYARAQEAAKRAEPILREKYGEKYSYYLQLTQYKINAEDRERQVNKIRSASGLEKGALSALSVATNLLASPGVLYEYTVQPATRAADWMPIDTNAQGFSAQNLTQDIRGVTAQALENQYGKAASFVYSTAMSGLDSFVAGNTFGKAGGVVLGFSAGAAQMMDVTARGGSIEEAVTSGIAAAVFEMLFETVSIGQMKAMQATAFQAGSLREMFSTKTLGTYVMNIGKEALVNFSEEAATEIANIMYDLTSLGDLSNIARQISTLMETEGLTEEQAKKIVAKTLGQQVLEAGLSGALMGAAFGAIDTSIAAYNQIENVKQLALARKLAATLPEAYRPSFDAANVTNETAAAYAVEVYLAAQRYNKAQQETQGAAKAQQEAESAAQAQQAMEEKAAVSVTTLASAQQVYEAQQEARADAQAETGVAQNAQDATVLSGHGNEENAVAGEAGNINGGETEADARARGEVKQLAQAFAGEELIQAVGDLANDRRMAGDAQGAAALEKALAGYQAGVYTGENEGGTADGREVYLRDGGEWNDGADSGGAVRGVAESAGRDPGGNLQGNGGRPAGAGGDAPGNQGAYRTVQGSTRQVTGFRNGEVSDSVGLFEELPPELEDLRQQVVKNGYSVRFTDGVMRFRTKRGTATVDGAYANGEIVVNARSAKWATEQLVNHEMFHGFARENDGLVDAMVAKVFGDLTDAQIEEIVAKYQEAYKGAGLSRQQALEEICADAFAGMDRKNIGLAGRISAAREFVGQQTGAQAATGMGTAARAGRASPISTQTGKAAGSVAGGFVRGEAYSKVSIDGEFYEPSDAQLVRTHKTIHVVPAGNARYASGVRMSKEEYNRYRDEQSEKLRRIFGIYTNRDTAYSDTYGLIEAEIGTKTMRKARSTGGVALLDIMPKLGDIFENAVVLGTKADRANDTNLKGIVDLLGCADLGNGNIAIVKLNVKEYTNDEAKLYGSRIVEIEKLTVLAGVGHSSSGGSTSYAASFDPILRRYREAVNREAENSPIRSGKEKETSEPNFSIAGERARTADRAALEDAREMEKQGMDAAEIFRETGWYMGRDGKWRFEFDDSAMRYSRMGDAQFRRNHPKYAQYQELLEKVFTGEELTAQEEGRLQSLDETWGREGGRLSERVARGNAYLEDILDHPVLFEAYPQLRETRIRFSELGDGENGNYDRKTNTITLSEKLRSAPEDTLVHEIQHAIQQAEGFAGGASPEYWDSRMQAGYSLGKNDRKIAQLDRQYREAFDAMPEELKKKVREINRAWLAKDFDHMLELEESLEGSEYEDAYLALTDLDWERRGLRENNEALSSRDLYRNTAGEIEARDVSRRRTWDADQRRNTMPDLGGENTVFAEDSGENYSIVEPFTDRNGKQYENAVLLDTDFFDGISPRNWGRRLKQYVESRSESAPFVMTVQDEYGNLQSVQFARKQDRVKKGRNLNQALSELYETPDNISKLAVIHIDEIAEVSEENNPYYTRESTHGWLDEHGWLHRNANVVNAKNGAIYNLTFDIAKARDGRTILYATKGKIKKVGDVQVHSLKIRGAEQNSNSIDSISDPAKSVNGKFSLADDSAESLTAQLEETEQMFSPVAGTDYDAQIREYDEKIESLELEAAGGDEAARGALITARLNRSALTQQREAAQAEQKPEAPTVMQKAARSQIAGLEKQITENKAKQKAEQTKYKEDGKAAHLEEAQRLKQLVTQQRAQIRQIKRDAGIQTEPGAESGRKVFRPTQTIRQTENRILDLFRIQAGSRAEMRGELHSILERILMDGYVGNSDVDRALRAMYEAGREVRPAADPVYEDIAKGLHGKKIYVSDEIRAEFGEDWNGVRQQLWGRGIYTSTDIRESGIDSVYAGLAGEYPGLFDEDNTDMRGMLEEILEAAQLGRAVHLTLGEAAEARGLTSDGEFEALAGEVMRELSKFADTAGVESRMRERTAQELERQRGQYAEARRKAAERRAVAEQMRKIRSSLNRLNKRARVNDQILSRTMSMQDEATREIMRQAQAQISTVANRITGKKMQNLLELKRVYEEAQAENPNFLPNPATEKALERVGQVHLQDLSVDELHTLYEAVERVTHDLKTQDELIGKAWDDQLDHAADGLEQEIEFSHGAKGEGKLAKLYNEESLSPSRALLRLVGYVRDGIMGKIVKEFEDGDIAAMEYEVGADKIFADFMKKNGDWLKTAAGKKAKVVEVEVPRILAWGEGDAPIYDENGPKTVKIKLTQMMLVQMALDARNEDNLRHIQYGGYSLPDIDRLKAGKTGSAYAKGEHVRGVKLAPEVLRRIVEENLDAQGKEYAQLLHRYYNQFSKDRINRTSRMLDGVDRAMTRDYYPMQSDQGYLPKQYNVFDGTLEGMGSLKERQSGARNAIILGEADATMRWHRDNMSRYVGYAVAKRNFEKLLNYRSSRGITIRESIKEKWGVNADAFLSDFMRTVEEGSLENVPDILSSITGNYVGSVLGFNVASMMKQLGAIPMAATKLGTGAMAVGLFQKGKSRDFILKYTPYLESRGKGYTYTEIADYSRKHEGRPSNRFMQTITGQNWLTAMDTAVNKAMWGAAEWYVRHQTNLRPGKQEDIDAGTDLFYQKVAEVFNRATHDTQTNYNLMSRPFALQRKGLRPFVMFRTDAYQAVGMIREAVGAWDTQVKHLKAADGLATKESVNEAGKLAVRAVLGVVSSNVLSAGIDLVRALLRGNDEEYEDEEGKLDLFRMGKDVARNTLINLLGGVVFVDTIAEFIDSQLGGDYFFAPELMGVASAEDFAGSIAEFVKTVGKSIRDLNALAKADGDTGTYLERQAEELAGAARDIALAVSQIFGLPLKNMERVVTTGLGLIYPGAKVAYNAVFSDVAKADLAGLEGDALVQGMTEYMRDELLFADEKVRDELVRLYGIYGAQILPGANAPTTRKLDDETERDLTVAEMGEWDAEYLRTMQKQLPEMISSAYYKSLSDDEKKAVLTSLNRFAAGAAKKRIGMEPDAWVANVLEAGENGAEISDTVVYRALANMLEADRDEEGKAVSGSVLKKKIGLLDGMALTDREREAILGAFEQSEGGKYALAVKNGLKWDEYAEMVTEGWGSAENYNKLIDDGIAHDTALDLLEVKAGLEPEEGKTSVTNAQIYEAIAAADMTEAERYDAIGAVLGLDSKGYDKMRVVQDTGLRAADYAALRGAEQEDQYLDAVELGMAANTAYAVVSAVAALPKLPEGERYTDAQRQAAACGACKSTAQQIDAYILYGNATYKTAEKAKLAVAAENYGVTPQMVLEFKELLARHDANGNGSYDKAEKKAALEASGFTREQKRALWQLHDPDSKSNPFGGAWDIRDAYEEAKEKEKAEKKN